MRGHAINGLIGFTALGNDFLLTDPGDAVRRLVLLSAVAWMLVTCDTLWFLWVGVHVRTNAWLVLVR